LHAAHAGDQPGDQLGQQRTTTFVVSNDGSTSSRPLSLRLVSVEGFSLGDDTCSGQQLAPRTTCSSP
jgi:hypothetical protein